MFFCSQISSIQNQPRKSWPQTPPSNLSPDPFNSPALTGAFNLTSQLVKRYFPASGSCSKPKCSCIVINCCFSWAIWACSSASAFCFSSSAFCFSSSNFWARFFHSCFSNERELSPWKTRQHECCLAPQCSWKSTPPPRPKPLPPKN